MNGLDLFRSPKTAADEIADIVSAQCPPVVPENAFDASPAWEDITAQVAINRVYNFLNQSKTAEKWGVNVRFTIEKNEGYEGEVSISGFGGAYE